MPMSIKYSSEIKAYNRVGIEDRPAIAEEKTEIGHWEGDTIIGGNHLGAIATYLCR